MPVRYRDDGTRYDFSAYARYLQEAVMADKPLAERIQALQREQQLYFLDDGGMDNYMSSHVAERIPMLKLLSEVIEQNALELYPMFYNTAKARHSLILIGYELAANPNLINDSLNNYPSQSNMTIEASSLANFKIPAELIVGVVNNMSLDEANQYGNYIHRILDSVAYTEAETFAIVKAIASRHKAEYDAGNETNRFAILSNVLSSVTITSAGSAVTSMHEYQDLNLSAEQHAELQRDFPNFRYIGKPVVQQEPDNNWAPSFRPW